MTRIHRHTSRLVLCGYLLGAGLSRSADVPSTNAPTVLPEVTVVGHTRPGSLTSPTLDQADGQKEQVPGGFTIRGTGEMDRGRASNFQDLLQGVPGVTLQTENGMEVSKVSIRGSGILSEDEPLGVAFLLDGFSFNQGDGEVILEDFDLGAIQYAEVFRGANAFKYGAFTLGGAVNLVSRTGYDADPFSVRVEGGSYGFMRSQVSSGGVEGPVDYFVSVTGRARDGYRQHSAENTEDVAGNLGWRISENLENRFYLTVARTDRLLPGGLTQEQMEKDPRQAEPGAAAQDLNKDWYYLRLADKISFKADGEQADAGVYWWHRNLLARGLFDTNSPDGIQAYYSDNLGLLLNSVTRGEVFGRQNLFTIGVAPAVEREVDWNFQNLSGKAGATTAHDAELSINVPLYAEDQHYVTEQLSLLAGIQAVYAERRFSDYFNRTPVGDQSANAVFRGLNPKAGVMYEFDPEIQAFANFSRSFQPPSFDNMVDFGDGPGDSLVFTPLEPQDAWTAEVGTRGERGRFGWELALYRSWVRDELLDVNNAQGVDRGAVNVGRSHHQGIEAELDLDLMKSLLVRKDRNPAADRLVLRQSYTLNDFHFDDDPVYGNNRIGGIPIHLYDASLMYEHPSGFYAGPNLQWNITHYPVDHANTLYADAYALVGFRVGFESRKGFSAFFEAKNLGDKRYAASVDPIPDARTADGPIEIFHPGDGRSFYGGVSWKW